MFFVVSTGRSGSRTMAALLSQSPNCVCLHEPEPRLIAECVEFRTGKLTLDQMTRKLRGRDHARDDVVYGEANNRLSLVLPALQRAYPDARYVWLVRDGRDFVSSATQRGWYDESYPHHAANTWETTRIRGDEVGEVSSDEWATWTPFRKVCWSWTYLNRLIGRHLGPLGDDVSRRVALEDLPGPLDELAGFLGIERVPWVVDRRNARTTLQSDSVPMANRVERVLTRDDWSAAQRADFEELCGELMDELSPNWRDSDAPEAPTAAPTVPGTDALVAATRADVAELGVIVREMQIQLRRHDRQLRDAVSAMVLDREQRALRRERDEAVRRAQQAERLLDEARRSQAFRIGHAIVRVVKAPLGPRRRRRPTRSVSPPSAGEPPRAASMLDAVLVVVVGAQVDTVRAALRRWGTEQRLERSIAPVLVADAAMAAELGDCEVLVEVVGPEHASDELRALGRKYKPVGIVVVPGAFGGNNTQQFELLEGAFNIDPAALDAIG